MSRNRQCVNCSSTLVQRQSVWVCLECNSDEVSICGIFRDDPPSQEHVFIKCPGATLFEAETDIVVGGVRFFDDDDPAQGYEIVDKPIFAPNHCRRRRIKHEALGKIRRCQPCQDYTIRMRRKEGADFFIPSSRHPRKTHLKTMEHVHYEP